MSIEKLLFDPMLLSRGGPPRSEIAVIRKIGFLICCDVEILDLIAPLDAFYDANRTPGPTNRAREPGYELPVITAEAGPVNCKTRLEISENREPVESDSHNAPSRARVEAEPCRLEQTSQSPQAIAEVCGFATIERMRRAFQRRLGVAPQDYRERFQSSFLAQQEWFHENTFLDDGA